jgi:hypothetical protein
VIADAHLGERLVLWLCRLFFWPIFWLSFWPIFWLSFWRKWNNVT